MKSCVSLFITSLVLTGSLANAQSVRRVPEDFPSIQSAIDAAKPGDRIRVGPGEWSEGLNIVGKAELTLEGANREACVLRPAGPINGIWLDSAPGFTIRSLTLKGDRLTACGPEKHFAGLAAAKSSVNITSVTIEGCPEIGISIRGTSKSGMDSVVIRNCGESALSTSGGSTVTGSGVTLADSGVGLWAGGCDTSVRLSRSQLTDNRHVGAYLADGAAVALSSTEVTSTPPPPPAPLGGVNLDDRLASDVLKWQLGKPSSSSSSSTKFENPITGLPESAPKINLFQWTPPAAPASKLDTDADGIRASGSGTKLALEDCTIRDYPASGVDAWAGAQVVLIRTKLHDMGADGASLNGLGAGSRIEYCEATGNKGSGISLQLSDGVVVKANTLDRNGLDGLRVQSTTALDARKNKCCANSRHGIVAFAPFDGRISENVALDNHSYDVAVGPGLESSPGITNNRVTEAATRTPQSSHAGMGQSDPRLSSQPSNLSGECRGEVSIRKTWENAEYALGGDTYKIGVQLRAAPRSQIILGYRGSSFTIDQVGQNFDFNPYANTSATATVSEFRLDADHLSAVITLTGKTSNPSVVFSGGYTSGFSGDLTITGKREGPGWTLQVRERNKWSEYGNAEWNGEGQAR